MNYNNCKKNRYTRQEAKKALKDIKREYGDKANQKSYYYCDKCNAYHLTKYSKAVVRSNHPSERSWT